MEEQKFVNFALLEGSSSHSLSHSDTRQLNSYELNHVNILLSYYLNISCFNLLSFFSIASRCQGCNGSSS